VDSDKSVLPTAKQTLSALPARQVRCIHDDFLSWSSGAVEGQYDCVVMNPPFAAKKADWIKIDLRTELGQDKVETRFAPIEVAFMCRAVRLLKAGGRLLAVVPSSVVAGETTRVFREALLDVGTLKYVHELPHFCFDGVESRMYLVAFDKGRNHRNAVLCNHDLHKPEVMIVDADSLKKRQRFDFGYFKGQQQLRRILLLAEYDWRPLSMLVTVHRGKAKSPIGPKTAVHTCDYRTGFWRSARRHRLGKRASVMRLEEGDILVKRVGRYCSRTFGRIAGTLGMECSDCVMILRPKDRRMSSKILFALRCLVALPWIAPVIEKGTGASYITERSLNDLQVPIALHKRFPKSFEKYKSAIQKRSFSEMCRVERYVAKCLVGHQDQ
jgi:hypothetical protein